MRFLRDVAYNFRIFKVLSVIVIIVLLYNVFIFGGIRIQREKNIIKKRAKIAEITQLISEYKNGKKRIQAYTEMLEKQGKTVSVQASVEQVINSLGLKNSLVYLNTVMELNKESYKIHEIELKLEGLKPSMLLETLYNLEDILPVITISMLNIKPGYPSNDIFDINIKLKHYKFD